MHARGSYFASPPSSPSANVPRSPGRGQYFSTTPNSGTPVYNGGMRSPMTISAYPATASPLSSPHLNSNGHGHDHGPLESPNAKQYPSRRPTLTSAIPIGYQKSTRTEEVQRQMGETRRRPSFKIDLPPRPAPVDLLNDNTTGPAGHTPYEHGGVFSPGETKITPLAERGAGRKLSLGALDMTDMRLEIDSIAYRAHAQAQAATNKPVAPRPPMRAPSFRDPFGPLSTSASSPAQARPSPQAEGNFMILKGPHDTPFESPGTERNDPLGVGGATGNGLGYSLNRLRAPTPWARKIEEEGEWLTAEDISKLHF